MIKDLSFVSVVIVEALRRSGQDGWECIDSHVPETATMEVTRWLARTV